MRKRILYLILTLLLISGSGAVAHAEDKVSEKDWRVTFANDKMECNFNSRDIADEVSGLQPGDSITIHVIVENKDSIGTDWYMANEVLESLEDSQDSASGGAYTYLLTYTNSRGETTELYNSDTVGGERNWVSRAAALGEGLHEATESLDEFFYLDRLDKGKTGTVLLRVALDGETQGNAYQRTQARLQMNFALEKVPDSSRVDRIQNSRTVYRTGSVQTGDQSRILLWSALALTGGIGAAFLAVLSYRKSREEEEYE